MTDIWKMWRHKLACLCLCLSCSMLRRMFYVVWYDWQCFVCLFYDLLSYEVSWSFKIFSWVLGVPSASLIFYLVIFRPVIKLRFFYIYVDVFPFVLASISGGIEWLMARALAACLCVAVALWCVLVMYPREMYFKFDITRYLGLKYDM